MKLGILGLGNHVTKNTLNSLLNSKYIKVTCFYVRNKNKGHKIANKYNLKFVNKITQLFNENIEIVYIACPPDSHFKYIKLSLSKKKHVICEKPLTMDFKKNQYLFEYANLNKLFLFEVCQYKFHKHYEIIKKTIKKDFSLNNEDKFFYSSFKIPMLNKDNFRLKKTNNDIIKFDIGFYPINLIDDLFDDIKVINLIKYKANINYYGNCYFKSKSLKGFIEWGMGFQYSNQLSYFSKNLIFKTENLFTKPSQLKPEIEKITKIKKKIILESENHFDNMFNEYFNIIYNQNYKKHDYIKEKTLKASQLLSKL